MGFFFFCFLFWIWNWMLQWWDLDLWSLWVQVVLNKNINKLVQSVGNWICGPLFISNKHVLTSEEPRLTIIMYYINWFMITKVLLYNYCRFMFSTGGWREGNSRDPQGMWSTQSRKRWWVHYPIYYNNIIFLSFKLGVL